MARRRALRLAFSLPFLAWLSGCGTPQPTPHRAKADRRALLLVLPDGSGYKAFVGPSIVVAHEKDRVVWEVKDQTGKDLEVEIAGLRYVGASPCSASSASSSEDDPFEEKTKKKEFKGGQKDRDLPLTVKERAEGCYVYKVNVTVKDGDASTEIEANDPQVDVWR